MFAGPAFMKKYMKLRDEINELEYRERTMPKKQKQTRRSISIRGESYDKLRRYCEAHGITMSGWLEDQAIQFLLKVPSGGNGNGRKYQEEIFEVKIPKEPPKKASKEPVRGGGTHLL